jgi:TolA-binding protein
MKKNGLVIPAFVWNPVISLTALILLFSMANCCLGFQDSAQQAVDDLKAQMATLNSQLTTIEAQINNGDGDLTALQSKYQDDLDELNETIEELKQSCLTAITADATNQKNIQAVMGILLNDANNGDDREVLRACDQLIAAGIHPAYFEYAAKAGRIKIDAREIFDEALIRQREFKSNDLPRVLLKPNKGEITVELYENASGRKLYLVGRKWILR